MEKSQKGVVESTKKEKSKPIVVIIGGSSGIGASTVDLLIEKNYKVHQISRHENLNPKVINHICDVINDEELKKILIDIWHCSI